MIDMVTMKRPDTTDGTKPPQSPSPGPFEPNWPGGAGVGGAGDGALGTEACDSASSPPGPMTDLRELITRALTTSVPAVLDAAEQDYRGVYESLHAYVLEQVAEHLAPHQRWVLRYCRPEGLRSGYEGGAVRLWTIALADGRVAVFESKCEPAEPPTT